MSELKSELGVVQGIGLLSTSLLGTGFFAIPAIIAHNSGDVSLWAWPVLLLLIFPIAITFATLGRYYPSAGGVAHFVGKAFGPRMAQVTGWLFLSVIPFGLPVGLQIAAGFWQAAFDLSHGMALVVQIATIGAIMLLGLRSAGSSANIQTVIAALLMVLIAVIWWKGDLSLAKIPFPKPDISSVKPLFNALAVMFWCFVGLEAFAHLASEFRHPKRDFPRALIVGLLFAGAIYWSCTVAVLHFGAYGDGQIASASLPTIVVNLFGNKALWLVCLLGYLASFSSVNVYSQSFARLLWSQARTYNSGGWLAKLSKNQTPTNALSIVQISCLISCIIAYGLNISLDILIVYANGIFVLVYLLCMIAGWKLLQNQGRVMAIIGTILSVLLLIMVGWKSLYAIVMFGLLWLVYPSIINWTVRRSKKH